MWNDMKSALSTFYNSYFELHFSIPEIEKDSSYNFGQQLEFCVIDIWNFLCYYNVTSSEAM